MKFWYILEDTTLSEINPMQKNKYSMIPLIYEVPQIVKFIKAESRIVVSRAGEVGNGKLLFNWYRISVWKEEKLLGVAQQKECT